MPDPRQDPVERQMNQPADQRRGALRTGVLDPNVLNEIVRRVVEIVQPEQIILFGSAARGDMTRHSDVDLLVVKEGVDALDAMGEIYGNLRGVGVAVDAIVVSPESLERYKDSHALIYKPALREGKVVYEAASALPAGRPSRVDEPRQEKSR